MFLNENVVLYSAISGPLDRTKRFTLFALHARPVHSDTNSPSSGSIPAMLQLRAKTNSLTCPPLSIARYSCIRLNQPGRQWRERKCFETVAKRDSNPGSLDCESGILPLSYRAPMNWCEWLQCIADRHTPGSEWTHRANVLSAIPRPRVIPPDVFNNLIRNSWMVWSDDIPLQNLFDRRMVKYPSSVNCLYSFSCIMLQSSISCLIYAWRWRHWV